MHLKSIAIVDRKNIISSLLVGFLRKYRSGNFNMESSCSVANKYFLVRFAHGYVCWKKNVGSFYCGTVGVTTCSSLGKSFKKYIYISSTTYNNDQIMAICAH